MKALNPALACCCTPPEPSPACADGDCCPLCPRCNNPIDVAPFQDVTVGAFTFVGYQPGDPVRGRHGDQLTDGHPGKRQPCPVCPDPIGDQPWQLLILGPSDDADLARHAAGQRYVAVAALAHRACLAALSEERLAELLACIQVVIE